MPLPDRARRAIHPKARRLRRPASRLLWTAAAGLSALAAARLGRREVRRLERSATLWQLAKAAFAKAGEDQITRLGAALAFYTLFSLAPLLLILVAVVGWVIGPSAASGAVVSQLQGVLGADKARVVQQVLLSARGGAAGGAAGLAILLFGGSYVVSELQASLNYIFGLPPARIGWAASLRGRLICLLFVLASGFLLLVSLGLNAAIAAAGKYLGPAVPEAGLHLAGAALMFCFIACMFGLVYRVLPQAVMRWRDAFIGGAVTAGLFEIGNILLALYIGKSGAASPYGAAGGVVALLVWSYYSAQIVYLGAEFTQVYASDRGYGIIPKA